MAGLRKWLRNKLDSQPKPSKEGTKHQAELSASLPFLLATRSHPLTPTAPEPSRLKNYGYFGRAPYEVRRQILVEAFGGRRVHMDLSFRHPLKRRRVSSSETAINRNGRRHCGLGAELVPDASQPQRWQWFGCVCHRRAGYSEAAKEQRYAAMEVSQTIQPCDDECLEGSEAMCSCSGGGDSDGNCFVGVMGWLLACWQAYNEGINILYSTNTFHISSLDLQLHLPRLMPRHHLERITSLELLWKLNSIQPRGSTAAPVADHIKPLWSRNGDSSIASKDSLVHTLCELIPHTFPRLQRLYISYQCWLDSGSPRGGDVISGVETIFLGPVEDMLRSCRHRRQESGGLELNVAIQRGAGRVLLTKYHTLLGGELRVESADQLSRGRLWKPLDDDKFGYWVCGGWEDMKVFGNDYWVMTNWGDKWISIKDTY